MATRFLPRRALRAWLQASTALAGSLPVLGLTVSLAYANPEGGVVTQGAATITQPDAKTVQVNQTSNRAVIDWKSFSIAQGETTRFVQPSSTSIILNRVTGDQVSQILGTLQANGQVVLVNPNGIVFGGGSKIDVGALIASTANIKTENFMAGTMKFDIPGQPNAHIINQGSISAADGGLVALVAPYLQNSGIISARLGKVALAGANGVTLDLYGDNLILFQASDKITQQMVGLDGKPVSSVINNDGQIYADGGRVLMTANVAKGVVDSAINTTGLVSARAVEQQGGEIILKGEDAGIVQVAGTLDASGKEAGQTGGRVVVTGQMVSLIGNAALDASGNAGGGRILVGGDHMGGNLTPEEAQAKGLILEPSPIRTADDVRIGSGVSLDASALGTGNGGKVSVWANNSTEFYGTAKAEGGPNGGNGGVVEISGGRRVVSQGKVNVTAKKGQVGRYLIDPAGSLYTSTNDFFAELDGGTVAYVSDIYTDTDGSIYILSTKNVSQTDYRVDPDGSRTYKTDIILTKISGQNIVAQSIVDTIYAGSSNGYGAQRGTLQVTSSGIKIFNSEKGSDPSYGQNGYIYTLNKDTLDATSGRQTLFNTANWGWAPYFDSNGTVHHFSFAGYYSVENTTYVSSIMPETFYRQMFSFRLNRANASGDPSSISEVQLSQALRSKAESVVNGQSLSSSNTSTGNSTNSNSSNTQNPSNSDLNGQAGITHGSNTTITHFEKSFMADVFVGKVIADFNDNGKLEVRSDRDEAVSATIIGPDGSSVYSFVVPGKTDTEFSAVSDIVFHFGVGIGGAIDNLSQGVGAAGSTYKTNINAANIPAGSVIRYESGTKDANMFTLMNIGLKAIKSSGVISSLAVPSDLGDVIVKTLTKDALKDPEIVSSIGGMLAENPAPGASEVFRRTIDLYVSYVEKNYKKILTEALVEYGATGDISSRVAQYSSALQEIRKAVDVLSAANGFGSAISTTSTLMARVTNGGGVISADIIGNDYGVAYNGDSIIDVLR